MTREMMEQREQSNAGINSAESRQNWSEAQMKNSASREQSHAGMNYAEAQPILERKLKDSGVKWIGEIPSHWTCSKQK